MMQQLIRFLCQVIFVCIFASMFSIVSAACLATSAKAEIISAEDVKCYFIPAQISSIRATLKKGSTVSVILPAADWSQIRAETNEKCWVLSKYLAASLDLTSPKNDKSLPLPKSHAKNHNSARLTSHRARETTSMGGCSCASGHICIGPRGGRYCITSRGGKRYGV
jgi:uncharacterized protein YgiM (DUF1202 family)